jgi:hypothetical protein
MDMELLLTNEEEQALQACAADLGISMEDAAHQAIREFLEVVRKNEIFMARAKELIERDKEILDRLAES